jgi:hypothetical protein
MSSNTKLISRGWILGVSLGLVCSTGAVFASDITDTYTTGDTLTAVKMTAIKTAVNDNDARLDAIAAGTQTCGAGMTKVGPTCVDTVRQAANTSWSGAVDFCRTANKRLLRPSEYLAAYNLNAAVFGMDTNGTFEWVDSIGSNGVADDVPAGGLAGRLTVGYMGPSDGTTFDPTVAAGEIFFANNAGYDSGEAIIFFRCAR